MRLICITTEYYVDKNGNPSSHISVRKGSIYNVVNVFDGEQIKEDYIKKHIIPPANGKWYELLEVVGLHHESKFLELPDYLYEENVEEKTITV